MSDTFEFEDKAKVDRLIGTLHDPAATVGDVLTVQADKSIAAQPGGGSMPTGVFLKTYTAAEIADRWEGVGDPPTGYSALPLPEIVEGQWVCALSEIANTLDQNVVTADLDAYAPGGSTTDVELNGTTMVENPGLTFSDPETYGTTVSMPTSGGRVTAFTFAFLAAGAQMYVMFTGDAAPTSGEITVAIVGS